MYGQSRDEEINPITIDIWITWIAATAVGVAGLTVFFYMNFQTKEAFAEYKIERTIIDEGLVKRLDRIEDKLDRLLSR